MPKYTAAEKDELLDFIYKNRDEIQRQTIFQQKHGQHISELLSAISSNGGKSGLIFWLKIYQGITNKIIMAITTVLIVAVGYFLTSI